jgi:two-component system, cell cycle sensor histidine kinase and response regulator CckA
LPLLVEDEPAVLQVSRALIERLGYTVLVASSPGDALALAANYPGDIHILVTDVVMPGLSGKELYARLRQVRPWLKCLYVSGYAEGLDDGTGILDEDVHLLEKPYSLRAIAEKLQKIAVANRWTPHKDKR